MRGGLTFEQLSWVGWPSKRRAVSGLLAGPVLVLRAVAAFDLARVVRNAGTLAQHVQHIYEVIGGAEGLLSTLKDAETGQRCYLLTGDDAYLQPNEDALVRVRAQLDDFASLVSDNPAQGTQALSMQGHVEGKLAELGQTVSLRRSGDVEGALVVVRSGTGKAWMDALRAEVAAFVAEERRSLAAAEAGFKATENAAALRALLASTFVLASGVAVISALSRRGQRAEVALADTAGELSERMSQLDALYASAPVGLSYSDRSLRYVAINERLAAMNGRPVAAHLGQTLREVLPEVADTLEPLYQRVLDTGEPVLDVDIRTRTASTGGQARDYLASYWPVRDGTGTVVGVNVAVLDITDRKAAETALAASKARLRTVFDTVPVGLVTAELPVTLHLIVRMHDKNSQAVTPLDQLEALHLIIRTGLGRCT